MRVFHHALLQSRGGAARVARLIAAGLADRGEEHVLTFEARDSDAREGLELGPAEFYPSLPGSAAAHLHSSGDWRTLLASGLALAKASGKASGRRIPTVITLHDCALLTAGCPYPLECREWERGCEGPCPRGFGGPCLETRELLQRLAPVLAAPSRWMAGLARLAVPGAEVTVVPNGVEWPAELLPRVEARRRLGLGERLPLALFVAHGGEAAAYRSGERWREAWEGIRELVPGAAGFFAGGFETRREGNLFLWPYVDRPTLALFMRAADVLVYPSLADNHPLVVLEAMAQGLPAVSFAVGGIPEQIEDGRTGLLVPAGDWPALVRAAARLLSSPRLANGLGEEARRSGVRRFSLGRMADDYLRLYERSARTL